MSLVAVIMLVASFARASPVTASQAHVVVTDELRCQVLTDAARQIGGKFIPYVRPYVRFADGKVGDSLDCTAAFTKAGLTLVPYGNPDDGSLDKSGIGRGWLFTSIRFIDDKKVAVGIADICPRCGHGEDLVMTRKGDHWKIIERKMSWIS